MPLPRIPAQKCMPMRKLIVIECFLGLTINYILRNCLSLAIIKMVGVHHKHANETNVTTTISPNECPYNETDDETDQAGDLSWTSKESQLVLGSYFYGYLVFMIPAGIIGDKVGASPMLMIGTLMSIVMTFLTPIASRTHFAITVTARIILGVGQAMYYAPLHCIIAAWIPPKERGTWGAVLFSGSHAGSFFNALLTGYMLAAMKWDYVFYIWGGVALIWLIIFALTAAYSSPDDCDLTEKEKGVFEEAGMHYQAHGIPPLKIWLLILMNAPVWAIIAAMWGHDFGLFTLTTELPTFMKQVLHFDIKKNGWMNSLIFLSIWIVGNVTGPFIDLVDRKKWISRRLNRVVGTTISSVGPSLGFLLSVYTDCSVSLALVSLFIGSALMGFFYSSLKLNPIDIAPAFSGTIGAITQTAGAVAGACVPVTMALIVPNGTLMQWRWFMWVIFIVMTATNIIYIIFARADPQPFNSPEDAERIKQEKEEKKQAKARKKDEKRAQKEGDLPPSSDTAAES